MQAAGVLVPETVKIFGNFKRFNQCRKIVGGERLLVICGDEGKFFREISEYIFQGFFGGLRQAMKHEWNAMHSYQHNQWANSLFQTRTIFSTTNNITNYPFYKITVAV